MAVIPTLAELHHRLALLQPHTPERSPDVHTTSGDLPAPPTHPHGGLQGGAQPQDGTP